MRTPPFSDKRAWMAMFLRIHKRYPGVLQILEMYLDAQNELARARKRLAAFKRRAARRR